MFLLCWQLQPQIDSSPRNAAAALLHTLQASSAAESDWVLDALACVSCLCWSPNVRSFSSLVLESLSWERSRSRRCADSGLENLRRNLWKSRLSLPLKARREAKGLLSVTCRKRC